MRHMLAGTTYTAACYVEPTSSNLNVQIRLLEYTQNFGSNTQLQAHSAELFEQGDHRHRQPPIRRLLDDFPRMTSA